MNIKLPSEVQKVFEILESHNHEAFLVGGSVRDKLLGEEPKDYDFTTDAVPEKIIMIFESMGYKTVPTGVEYGTITVIIDDESFEITTYRSDGDYNDGRRPSKISFSKSIDEDLKRRDFTINAMAYNPKKGLVDNYGGKVDLESGIIRAVGNAEDRLKEDFLRAFRAVRFANQLDMKIEKSIKVTIDENKSLVRNISKERINEELTKTLLSSNKLKYIRLLSILLEEVLPELSESLETPQNHPYHMYNVGIHTIEVVNSVENDIVLKLSALLHDMGKPKCRTTDEKGIDHFYGHNKVSTKVAKRFLKELRFSNDILNKVERLVYYHDRPIEPREKSVRKALNQVGEDIFLDLLKLKEADIKGQNIEYIDRLDTIEKVKEVYKEVVEQKQCFSLKNLAINGRDLIDIGIEPGKEIGIILDKLLEKVIDKPELNEKSILLDKVKNTKINKSK